MKSFGTSFLLLTVILTAAAGCERNRGAKPSENGAPENWGVTRDARGNITLQNQKPVAPEMVFAAEGSTEALKAILAQPEVIPELQEMHAGIALATTELSPGRAQIVRQLNAAGIPVTAWLALPKAQGYYVNAENAAETEARFAEFEKWSAEYQLHWAGVGLDIEPSVREFSTFFHGDKLGLAWLLAKRYFDLGRVTRARKEYAKLIGKMQAAGYAVQTYQFPFLADERIEDTTVLERVFGIVDVRGNLEVLMIYTSFHHSLDSAMIWAYGREAQAIAVGVTNQAANAPGFTPLDWDELSRDMIVASYFARTIGVYNLEGCVEEGFLPRIAKLNWGQPVTISAGAAQGALLIRKRVQQVIWIAAHLLYFVAGFFAALICVMWWWSARRRQKRSQIRLAAGREHEL
ncbi:MAG TPA: hypothetical protein VLV88_08850 [Terriglobales bacterium]|nr:hypothetical protein [Terriglobales bacterium]HUL16090.1 hypothetical protein [Terriglobales bacterium]